MSLTAASIKKRKNAFASFHRISFRFGAGT